MGHVFRVQYELVKYVDTEFNNQTITEKTATRLIHGYRALLSDPELHLLLYYGLSSFAPPDFRDLIDKYGLLYGLLDKNPRFVCYRIPELCFYPETLAEWHRRHPPNPKKEPPNE